MDGTTEWTGAVPKPAAVKLLQIAGVLVGILAVALAALGFSLREEKGWAAIYFVLAYFALVVAFALLSAWKRPSGLVAGMIALALLLPVVPIGPIIVAIVAFVGIKDREHVRDYYGQGIKRDE